MISVKEADDLIGPTLGRSGEEEVPLNKALGRVLSRPVSADQDQPPFHRVAMDGIAVNRQLLGTTWVLEDTQRAGSPPKTLGNPENGFEVATGAVLPRGCDTVIPLEDLDFEGRRACLKPGCEVILGSHIHSRGSDYPAERELITSGTRILSAHVPTLATVGLERVYVRRQALVRGVSTGDEIVPIGATPEAYQIRGSNLPTLDAEARAWGLPGLEVEHCGDDEGDLLRVLGRGLEGADFLVISGGVSFGVADFVPRTLKALGVTEVFAKVAQKPGKPLWFGTRGQTLVFALPGNPVANLFTFRRYVLPALLAFEGRSIVPRRVPVQVSGNSRPGFTTFLPLRRDQEGALVLAQSAGSGNFFQMAGTAGFIQVDEASAPHIITRYPWFPWGGQGDYG